MQVNDILSPAPRYFELGDAPPVYAYKDSAAFRSPTRRAPASRPHSSRRPRSDGAVADAALRRPNYTEIVTPTTEAKPRRRLTLSPPIKFGFRKKEPPSPPALSCDYYEGMLTAPSPKSPTAFAVEKLARLVDKLMRRAVHTVENLSAKNYTQDVAMPVHFETAFELEPHELGLVVAHYHAARRRQALAASQPLSPSSLAFATLPLHASDPFGSPFVRTKLSQSPWPSPSKITPARPETPDGGVYLSEDEIESPEPYRPPLGMTISADECYLPDVSPLRRYQLYDPFIDDSCAATEDSCASDDDSCAAEYDGSSGSEDEEEKVHAHAFDAINHFYSYNQYKKHIPVDDDVPHRSDPIPVAAEAIRNCNMLLRHFGKCPIVPVDDDGNKILDEDFPDPPPDARIDDFSWCSPSPRVRRKVARPFGFADANALGDILQVSSLRLTSSAPPLRARQWRRRLKRPPSSDSPSLDGPSSESAAVRPESPRHSCEGPPSPSGPCAEAGHKTDEDVIASPKCEENTPQSPVAVETPAQSLGPVPPPVTTVVDDDDSGPEESVEARPATIISQSMEISADFLNPFAAPLVVPKRSPSTSPVPSPRRTRPSTPVLPLACASFGDGDISASDDSCTSASLIGDSTAEEDFSLETSVSLGDISGVLAASKGEISIMDEPLEPLNLPVAAAQLASTPSASPMRTPEVLRRVPRGTSHYEVVDGSESPTKPPRVVDPVKLFEALTRSERSIIPDVFGTAGYGPMGAVSPFEEDPMAAWWSPSNSDSDDEDH